jgi:hypothetical protein
MKGHTRIELKDVNTGNVQVIDEDNMVTAGLQKMLQPYPFSTNNFASQNNIIGNAIGGLLLFEDAIEEDINNYLPPVGNKMTGRGVYQKTYSGEVVELGSFNEAESGLQDDGSVKFVWDFNTSQANGKISCVSLTSLLGGNLGLGDSVYKQQNTIAMHRIAQIFSSYNTSNIVYISDDENICLIELPYSENNPITTGIIRFKKVRFPLSNISVFDKCIYLDNTYNGAIKIDSTNNVEELSFTLPQKVLDTTGSGIYFRGGNVKFSADGKLRYIFSKYDSNVAADGIFYLCLIDVNSNTIEVKDITNKTGCELHISDRMQINYNAYGFTYTSRIAVTSKYIFCLGKKDSVWKLFRININDNSDVVELDYTYNVSSPGSAFNIYLISDEKIIFKDNASGCIIDVESCIVSMFDYASGINNNYVQYHYQIKGNKMLLCTGTAYNGNQAYISQYPIPILTINNLTEPVTKTSAHTMKVTYTLSEE